MKKLIEIIKGIKILSSHGNTNKSINGITDNSKNVKNNFLFFAIEGNDLMGIILLRTQFLMDQIL